MAATEQHLSQAQRPSPLRSAEQWLIEASKLLFAIFCVGYAVMAFDYFIAFAAGREGLWLQLLAVTVSSEFALGPGSAHVEQHQAYAEALRFMLMHTTMGAVCLAIGPFQFVSSFRRNYAAAHRALGKIYLVSVLLSMFAGLGYLWVTPATEVYSGVPFALGLLGLDLMVIYSAVMAYNAIRRRDIFRHQAWMALNYALLLPTPVLRLFWIIFGVAFPSLDQEQANIAITTFLIPISALFGMIWIAAQRPTRQPA